MWCWHYQREWSCQHSDWSWLQHVCDRFTWNSNGDTRVCQVKLGYLFYDRITSSVCSLVHLFFVYIYFPSFSAIRWVFHAWVTSSACGICQMDLWYCGKVRGDKPRLNAAGEPLLARGLKAMTGSFPSRWRYLRRTHREGWPDTCTAVVADIDSCLDLLSRLVMGGGVCRGPTIVSMPSIRPKPCIPPLTSGVECLWSSSVSLCCTSTGGKILRISFVK